MKAFHDFINLMTRVLDYLPRYLDLSEKEFLSSEEEIELNDIADKIESYKAEIFRIVPDLNISLSDDLIKSYYDSLHSADNLVPDLYSKADKFKDVFRTPIEELLKVSQN
jgi:hypothetical protein